jgi:hypothetical protein
MAIFTSNAGTYQNAVDLIKSLKDNGIESSVIPGGVDIRCSPDQVNQARQICESLGASFEAGYSDHEMVVIESELELYDRAIIVTKNANSVINEWR